MNLWFMRTCLPRTAHKPPCISWSFVGQLTPKAFKNHKPPQTSNFSVHRLAKKEGVRDLEVVLETSMKMSTQCTASEKANSMLEFRKGIDKRTANRHQTQKRNSFTQQVMKFWNSLPREVVMAMDPDSFKRGLDRLREERSINGYLLWFLKDASTSRGSQTLNPSAGRQQWGMASTPCLPYRATSWTLCETGCWIRGTTGLIQNAILMFLSHNTKTP